MLKRIITSLAALAALGALALGGSVIASAKQPTKPHAKKHAVRATSERTNAADTNSVQSGDQTTPDSGAASAETGQSDSPAEAPSSEADGPGGYQDPPGANSDTQQQGQN